MEQVVDPLSKLPTRSPGFPVAKMTKLIYDSIELSRKSHSEGLTKHDLWIVIFCRSVIGCNGHPNNKYYESVSDIPVSILKMMKSISQFWMLK